MYHNIYVYMLFFYLSPDQPTTNPSAHPHGCGFSQGHEVPTHTHIYTHPYLQPAWVYKPMTIPRDWSGGFGVSLRVVAARFISWRSILAVRLEILTPSWHVVSSKYGTTHQSMTSSSSCLLNSPRCNVPLSLICLGIVILYY